AAEQARLESAPLEHAADALLDEAAGEAGAAIERAPAESAAPLLTGVWIDAYRSVATAGAEAKAQRFASIPGEALLEKRLTPMPAPEPIDPALLPARP